MSWAFDGKALTIDLTRWLVERREERPLSEWAERGWLTQSELRIPLSDWIAQGAPPAVSDEDAASLEAWRAEHDRLARLVGVEAQRLAVRSVGHLMATAAKIEVSLDTEVRREAPRCDDLLRAGHALAPSTAFAVATCNDLANAAPESRHAALHRLKSLKDRLAELPSSVLEIALDEHLASVKVQKAEKVSLSWVPEGSGQVVSLQADALMPDGTRRPIDIGHLDASSRVLAADANAPVILPDEMAHVVPLVKARRREPKRRRANEIANPSLLLPEGINFDPNLDLSEYAERVVGFEQVKTQQSKAPIEGSNVGWFEVPDPEYFLSVEAIGETGREVLKLSTREEAVQFAGAAKAAVERGARTFAHAGRTLHDPGRALAVVEPLLAATEEAQNGSQEEGESADRRKRWAAVLGELHANEDRSAHVVVDEKIVPWGVLEACLLPGIQLKPHQRQGVAWMWGHLVSGTKGVLLADDMGLGKTLQVAAVLALASKGAPSGLPDLIVCPTVLLQNWLHELERFFRPEVFSPITILHGEELRRHKRGEGLDADRLSTSALVITNYETLAAHQLSLLRVDWNVVAFDEAHQLKNETTLRARGAAGLKRRFGVAMTGTPVENRLSDVWAVFDTLEHEPPRTFGTRGDFVTRYERSGAEGIEAVRRALRIHAKTSLLLRREKAEALRDLPPKKPIELAIPMSTQQFDTEKSFLKQLKGASALKLLLQLQYLYEHPLLLSKKDPWDYSCEQLIDMSPKLKKTCEKLGEIRSLGEKALVFTRFTGMQDILVRVFRDYLGLEKVPVINGDEHNRSAAQENIRWFEQLVGFGVMVLSPIAAGVGLTITAANHVFHYGRWWNPAKEEQATDRAHRIGQTRTVNVYYPTLHHPTDPERGFDRNLHRLVEKKRATARNFLRPVDELELSAKELSALRDRELAL